MAMAPSLVPQVDSKPPPPTNLHNPLPLSATQEQEVKKLFHARVRAKCSDEIKQFADCARGRMFSVAWACKTQQFQMNSCMMANSSYAEEDAAREEWFAGVYARRKKKEDDLAAVEKRRARLIELTRKAEEKEAVEAEAKRQEQAAQGKSSGWWK